MRTCTSARKTVAMIAALPMALALPAAAAAAEVQVQIKAPLDEPYHYCFDLDGLPANPDFSKPVQAHACKPRDFADQTFDPADIKAGRLRLPMYDKCLQAEAKADAALMVGACSAAASQRWTFAANGQIRPASAGNLCLTVDPGPGKIAGSPPGLVFHVRLLRLRACDPAAAERQTWALAPTAKAG